jgi:hypothetical protein
MGLGITSFAAFHAGSLRIVAGVQVAILGAWWLFNEWTLRNLTGETVAGWMKFLGIYGLASGGYWVATTWNEREAGLSVLAYYVGIGVVLSVMCQRELRIWGSIATEKS